MRLNRIHLFHDEGVCRAFVSTVINVRVPYRARYVLASWVTASFQGTATWNCWVWLCGWVRVVWHNERYVQIRLIRILWSVSFSKGNIKLATAETSLVASRVPHVEVREVYGSAALFKLTQLILPEMTLRSRGSTPSCWSKAAQILCLLTRTTWTNRSRNAGSVVASSPKSVCGMRIGALEVERPNISVVDGPLSQWSPNFSWSRTPITVEIISTHPQYKPTELFINCKIYTRRKI
jgi:hypothetical protein